VHNLNEPDPPVGRFKTLTAPDDVARLSKHLDELVAIAAINYTGKASKSEIARRLQIGRTPVRRLLAEKKS